MSSAAISTPTSPKSPPNEEESIKEDFRTKQIHELQQLQSVLDENTILRSKYNALLTQVAPLVDSFGPSPGQQGGLPQFQPDREFTPEEIEQIRQKLDQTLAEYREETRIASLLNSEIEKKYNELSQLKMKFRLDQDEKLTKQNQASIQGMSNFKAKSERVHDAWRAERQRLNKAITFLKTLHDSSVSDTKEYEEQNRSNTRGIHHLSSSITIAKEDIRDFTDQLQKINPKIEEYNLLKEKHQQSEEQVVKLSDELDRLKKKVDTESLTANVRRQIDSGNHEIADLNRTIDHIINKTASTQDKVKEIRSRIILIEKKLEKTRRDTEELKKTKELLKNEKEIVKLELEDCRKKQENAAGENALILKELKDGISIEKTRSPWDIKKQILELKGDINQLYSIEEKQIEFESQLENSCRVSSVAPVRKRVAMIPLKKTVS